jgi:UDP-2,3-diacylglucosamine pyrophosphatase LpxH
MLKRKDRLRLRTVFISDIRLGCKACGAELLLDFLHHVETDTLCLLGDIMDACSMQTPRSWPQSHNDVLYAILGKGQRGTRVILVPGNHGKALRAFDGAVFGNLEIHREYIHEGAAGRRILVMHRDVFDRLASHGPKRSNWAGHVFGALGAGSAYTRWMRRQGRLPHESRSFEDAVTTLARNRGVDTLVCGHTHHDAVREIDGILHCNLADWLENCTALIEDMNGQLRLIDWRWLRELIEVPIGVPVGRAA